jgi:secreted protein with Ig-like and vWFA domain
MSSPILPITGPLGRPSQTSPLSSRGADFAAIMSTLSSSSHEPDIEAARGGPPPELLEQMAGADQINQQLRESGRQLRFATVEDGPGATVELQDLEGNTLRGISVAEAVEIAAGKPVE